MEITVQIGCIDDDTGYSMSTSQSQEYSAKAAREFLKKLDHEGRPVSLTVRVFDDRVYQLLDLLDKMQEQKL